MSKLDIPEVLLKRKVGGKRKKDIEEVLSLKHVRKWIGIRGYARCSTDLQEDSIETQSRAIRRRATDLGIPLLRMYTDEGVSGADRSRPGLQLLFQHMREGEIILMVSISRLGRMQHTTNEYVRTITRKGCRLMTIQDGIDTAQDNADIFILFHEIFAQKEREMIRKRVKDGMDRLKEQGKCTGSPPFGKDIDPATGFLVANPQQQETIRMMIQMRRLGMTYENIGRMLTMKGIPTPRADRPKNRHRHEDLPREWQTRTVRSIIIREMGAEAARNAFRNPKTVAALEADTFADSYHDELEYHDDSTEHIAATTTIQTDNLAVETDLDVKKQTSETDTWASSEMASKPLALLRVRLINIINAGHIDGITVQEVRELTKNEILVLLNACVRAR